MKALTLHQPWASLVAWGVKTIETRSWKTDYRGPLAIHASIWTPSRCLDLNVGSWVMAYAGDAEWSMWDRGLGDLTRTLQRVPHGAVVATCELAGIVPIVRFLSEGPGHEPDPPWEPYDGPEPPMPCAGLTADRLELRLHRPYRVAHDQLPYGNYEPGRYAWLLQNIKRLREPIPVRGHQRLWNCSELDQ